MRFQHQDVIALEHDGSSLLAAPQFGGRLLRWRIGDRDIITWPDEADWSNPAKVRGGNPLLFPFIGRHRVNDRVGAWRDAQGAVYALPVHGFARDLPFDSALDVADSRITMTLTHSDATRAVYPFAFLFTASYRLVDGLTLEVELTARNTGEVPLPYYAGHHFYFALPHTLRGETTLCLPPAERLHQREDGSIAGPETGLSRYTLDDPSIVDRFHRLQAPNADARAVLTTPSLGRTITLEFARPGSIPWYAVTTWTEHADSNFYCVEPWLGLPNAIANGLGLRWLAPGASETAALRIGVAFAG
jgi:galactose mutarotase-like enzyme